MLKYFFDNDLIYYSERDITDWRDAISESCQLLLDKKIIDQIYVDEIIRCVENIQNLSELLMTDGLIESLVATNSLEEYQAVMKEYDL